MLKIPPFEEPFGKWEKKWLRCPALQSNKKLAPATGRFWFHTLGFYAPAYR